MVNLHFFGVWTVIGTCLYLGLQTHNVVNQCFGSHSHFLTF